MTPDNHSMETIGDKLLSDVPEVWTAKEMADYFDRTPATIRYVIRSRNIQNVARVGTERLFDMPAVELVAIALAEIQRCTNLSKAFADIEAMEKRIEADEAFFTASPPGAEVEAIRQRRKQIAEDARKVLEDADHRINILTESNK